MLYVIPESTLYIVYPNNGSPAYARSFNAEERIDLYDGQYITNERTGVTFGPASLNPNLYLMEGDTSNIVYRDALTGPQESIYTLPDTGTYTIRPDYAADPALYAYAREPITLASKYGFFGPDPEETIKNLEKNLETFDKEDRMLVIKSMEDIIKKYKKGFIKNVPNLK